MNRYTFNNVVNFKCVDKACKKSCCKLWQIKIDKKSLNKYKDLAKSDGRFITNVDYDLSAFKMSRHGDCKFLNKDGLCDLILDYGDGALCNTCKTHPRFKSFFKGAVECGVGLSCEEGARLILGAKDKLKLVKEKTGKKISLTCQLKENPQLTPFEKGMLKFRRKAISIAQDRRLKISQRVDGLLLLSKTDIKRKGLNFWLNLVSDLERLDTDSNYFYKRLISSNLDYDKLNVDDESMQIAYEQLLSYFLFRHIPKSRDYTDLYLFTSLAVALFYLVVSGVYCGEKFDNSARIISTEIEYSEENIDEILIQLEGLVRLN